MTTAKPSSQSFDFKSLFKSNDAAVAIAVVMIIGTMLVSLPTPLMDVFSGIESGTFHWDHASEHVRKKPHGIYSIPLVIIDRNAFSSWD